MSMSANIHGATVASHNRLPNLRIDGLEFRNSDGDAVNIFVPADVAQATAEAFNRAMREVAEKEAAIKSNAEAYRIATGAA